MAKIGDTVELNSGGPPMKVVALFDHKNVIVTWQDEHGRTRDGIFPVACVKPHP